jgi:hypothetical protein
LKDEERRYGVFLEEFLEGRDRDVETVEPVVFFGV